MILKLSLYNISYIKDNIVSQLLFRYQTVYGRHIKYTIVNWIQDLIANMSFLHVCISLKKKLSELAINCEDIREINVLTYERVELNITILRKP